MHSRASHGIWWTRWFNMLDIDVYDQIAEHRNSFHSNYENIASKRVSGALNSPGHELEVMNIIFVVSDSSGHFIQIMLF